MRLFVLASRGREPQKVNMVRKAGAGCGPVADESDPPKASFQAGKELG